MSGARMPEPSGDESGDEEAQDLIGETGTVFRLFESLPVMLMGMAGPPDFRITAVNAATRATADRPRVRGLPLFEAFAEMGGQRLRQLVEEVYATGAPMIRRDFRVQLEAQPGERVELFVDVAFAPTFAPDGTVDGVAVASFDVTASVRERQAAARRASAAQRRYEQAKDVIDTLQRELLPAGVPVLPGLQIAASYLLAEADTAAGGDWFDALILADGTVALIVGDVVGHGVGASATMGRLQVVMHERLTSGGGLIEAIEATDRVARTLRGARASTVCVAVIEPGTGALTYCTAGHPAPLLLGAEPRYLPGSGSGPLGVGSRFAVATGRLAPGETLLLYTDGILERPGRELPAATVEFAQTAADVAANRAFHAAGLPVERIATQTLELLTRSSGYSDDITLLAAQRVPAGEDLRITTPSDVSALPHVRRELRAWLRAAGVDKRDAGLLQHAVGELVTNAIEHAHPGGGWPAAVTITAALTPAGRLRAQVADDGRWREPRPSEDRGFGLAITADLIDDLDFDRAERGTTATITHTLTRPASLLTSQDLPQPVAEDAADPELFLVLDQPSAPRPRVRVDGPIDTHTAERLYGELQTATAAGTRSLTVDLAGVTHLSSAGVAVLHRLARQSASHESELRLYAPAGGPAQAILELVRLPHTTADPDY